MIRRFGFLVNIPIGMFSLLGVSSSAHAQSTSVPPRSLQGRRPLAEYEGVYAYQGTMSLAIVAKDTGLVAVIDEAKYPLRSIGGDRFLNSSGDTIPFRRGADGSVSGFVEHAVFYPRHTPVVDAAITAAVRAIPRPASKDGRSSRYRYAIPRDVRDGLKVGDARAAGFNPASVARLVNRVVDGTYPDVHSVLVYRGGKLVVEEYFYGYDR